jgi:hypothetical protein
MRGRYIEAACNAVSVLSCINISQLLFIILINTGTDRRMLLTVRVPKDSKFCVKMLVNGNLKEIESNHDIFVLLNLTL